MAKENGKISTTFDFDCLSVLRLASLSWQKRLCESLSPHSQHTNACNLSTMSCDYLWAALCSIYFLRVIIVVLLLYATNYLLTSCFEKLTTSHIFCSRDFRAPSGVDTNTQTPLGLYTNAQKQALLLDLLFLFLQIVEWTGCTQLILYQIHQINQSIPSRPLVCLQSCHKKTFNWQRRLLTPRM